MSKYKRLHVTSKHVDEWYAEPFDYPMLVDSDGKVVAMCLSSDAGYDHLFAAAPDMLEVLQELNECASYWSQYDVPVGIHDRIKLAIAKAKGEQP
jgi:hypothetical protein